MIEDDIVMTNIKKRMLGNTGIQMTCMGFGCASVWGKSMITDEQAKNIFEEAYNLGIRYFDTGYSYGCAEERIGKVLQSSNIVKRENIIISTKFGTKKVGNKYVHDFTPKWMTHSVKTSLKRMGIDYVDLLLVHGPQVSDLTDEYLATMRKLKKQRIVRAIGINTFDTEVIEFVCATKCFDFIMLDYNILRQDREELIKKLYDNKIGVIAGAPLAESLYSNRIFKIKSVKDIWYLARAFVKFREQLIKGRKFRFINKVQGITGTQIALKYVLDNPYITSAVFGTTSSAHLIENVSSKDLVIPTDVIKKIRGVEDKRKNK